MADLFPQAKPLTATLFVRELAVRQFLFCDILRGMDKPKLTPKDFFLYLGALATLYWSAGSLIALLFTIVDMKFRDELQYYVDPYSGGIRFAIASLIVVFPVSLALFRALKKDALAHPEKFLLPLRRWLYAITIFATAAALIGDLIALLNGFLGGELTARFALKVVSVLAVAGIVFWFALLEVRMKPDVPARVRSEFLWGTPLLVLAAVLYGLAVMGSPATIRKLHFDERRVSDLQNIQWQIVNYWQQKGRFPKSLADLEDPISGYRNPMDPRSKQPYSFTLGEGYVFELCAAFELPSNERSRSIAKPYPSDGFSENWEHGSGRVCFERVIDPERYPVRPKGV